MSNYVERLRIELEDLDKKIGSLGKFIGENHIFTTLEGVAQEDMVEQFDCMKEYSRILTRRIERETDK